MAFPPLVSSTPPPLDNFGESDEDEFGDFTAGGIDGIYIIEYINETLYIHINNVISTLIIFHIITVIF